MVDSKWFVILENSILLLFGSYFNPKWFFSILTLMFLNGILTHRFKKLFGTNMKKIISEFINNFFILTTVLFAARIFSEALEFPKMMVAVVTVFIVKEILALFLVLKKKTQDETDPEKRKLNNLLFNKLFQMFANAAGIDLNNTSDDPFSQRQNVDVSNNEVINNYHNNNESKVERNPVEDYKKEQEPKDDLRG